MEKMALGLIETVGMVAALEAADAAVKSANVKLIGYELTKGGGMVTIKMEGDVGAVNAAVQAGCAAAQKLNQVYSSKVIPRPHDELRPMILSKETVGASKRRVDRLESGNHQEDEKKNITCNLCNDIKCTRVKGDLKTNCIHYFDN